MIRGRHSSTKAGYYGRYLTCHRLDRANVLVSSGGTDSLETI